MIYITNISFSDIFYKKNRPTSRTLGTLLMPPPSHSIIWSVVSNFWPILALFASILVLIAIVLLLVISIISIVATRSVVAYLLLILRILVVT